MKKYQGRFFLICLFLMGLLTVFSYGAHLDQESEQEIMYSNIKMYLHRFGGTECSLYRQLDDHEIIEIADSIEKDHGMAVYYPMFWIFYVNQFSPFMGNIVWHVYIYLLVFCGIAALYGLLRNMFDGFPTAALTTSLLFLSPRMFAESHYNNKDMVLLSLTLCIIYFGWKLWKETSWKYVIAFSLAGSLAVNMKIISLLIWGMIGLFILCAMLYSHRFDRKIFIKMLVCIALMILFYVLVTPACWTDPVDFIRYLVESAKNFRWNDYILFEGSLYNKNTTGMPRRYLPIMILLTVPAGILLLSLIGLGGILLLLVRKPSGFFGTAGYAFVVFLSGMIPLGYAILSGTPVYNGWRHFYFCYGSILIMTAYGISFLLNAAEKHRGGVPVRLVLGAYALWLAAGILINHPYEYAYYNFLAGGHVENFYELDYWDMSFKQAYEVVLKYSSDGNNSPDGNVTIGTLSNPAFWGLEAQLCAVRGEDRMRIVLCDDWQNAQYLIINPMYAYMYDNDEYVWVKEHYELTDSLVSYGSIICEVYCKGASY